MIDKKRRQSLERGTLLMGIWWAFFSQKTERGKGEKVREYAANKKRNEEITCERIVILGWTKKFSWTLKISVTFGI